LLGRRLNEYQVIPKDKKQVIPKDKKQLVFAPASLILTNYFLPLIEALGRVKLRQEYLDSVNSFEPFTRMVQDGHSSEDIKSSVIHLLTPFVQDIDFLEKNAVSLLANEATCIGQLMSKPRWKTLLVDAFEVRNSSLDKDKQKAIDVMANFEPSIREAQAKYSLQIIFENIREDYELDEYAFELFRIIGALIESVIQPFLREYYCLLLICHDRDFDIASVIKSDFGRIINNIEELNSSDSFTKPYPWGIRINQWRNIAQHHSYSVSNDLVLAEFGKGNNLKNIELEKHELFNLSKELIRRLGALKSSRELTILNYNESIIPALPKVESLKNYGAITELASSFATQGFKMVKFTDEDRQIEATFIDLSEQVTSNRQIHCSQFLVPITTRFPGRNVKVIWTSQITKGKVTFSAKRYDLKKIITLSNPLAELANVMVWKHSP